MSFINSPPGVQRECGFGVKVSFRVMLSYHHITESALNGAPSDHFASCTKCIVTDLPSGSQSHERTMLGTTPV